MSLDRSTTVCSRLTDFAANHPTRGSHSPLAACSGSPAIEVFLRLSLIRFINKRLHPRMEKREETPPDFSPWTGMSRGELTHRILERLSSLAQGGEPAASRVR